MRYAAAVRDGRRAPRRRPGSATGPEGRWPAAAENAAMRRALVLAAPPASRSGPTRASAACSLDADGRTVAEGYHRGAGTPHAEVDALAAAGGRARGSTAVVTLEPCTHTGRTGPCADALVAAGVAAWSFAQRRPQPGRPGGWRGRLRAAGVDVRAACSPTRPRRSTRSGRSPSTHGRPFVTWKFAATLDGRSAAADGTSRWITPGGAGRRPPAAGHSCDAVLVGTGTVARRRPAAHRARRRRASRAAASRCASWSGCATSSRRAGPRRPRRDRPPARPVTRATARGAVRAGPPARAARGRARRWPRPSSATGSSTRSSPTSRRCCSARAAAPSADLGIATIADALRPRPSPTSTALAGPDEPIVRSALNEELECSPESSRSSARSSRSRTRATPRGSRVRGPLVPSDAAHGDSIAVNGVCLTVVERAGDAFTADVMEETLDRPACSASLARATGQPRAAVTADDPARRSPRAGPRRRRRHDRCARDARRALGGRRASRCRAEPGPLRRREGLDHRRRRLAHRGRRSATTRFTGQPDPTTLGLTTLGPQAVGDPVNLEVDVIAKYVERLLARAAAARLRQEQSSA